MGRVAVSMMEDSPFVIVLASAANRVGRSTLADNLPVYLKALVEDLPVAVLSLDSGYDPAKTFALPGTAGNRIDDLFAGQSLGEQLTCGQFGVEYLKAGCFPGGTATQLRSLLAESHYPGILILDAGSAEGVNFSVALHAADLLLVPIREVAGLSALSAIRREFKSGGGADKHLWLLPSMVEDTQKKVSEIELLHFAASERGYLTFEDEFVLDAHLPERTSGVGGSVLTRMPESPLHPLLHNLAKSVLIQFEIGPDVRCRLKRLQADGVLEPRAKRVDAVCPLCGKLACFSMAHYCESLPQRRRCLIHADCLNSLMLGLRSQPFWNARQVSVLRTGVETNINTSQLRLLLASKHGELIESELFQPAEDSGWLRLVRDLTGRSLLEQSPSLIFFYPAISGPDILGRRWYQECINLRKKLRLNFAADF